MFQLRLMFEHEINGMDADADEPVSLNTRLFDEDFLIEKKRMMQPAASIELPKMPFPPVTTQYRTESTRATATGNRLRAPNSPCATKKKTSEAV